MNHNELNIEEIVTELLNNLAERDNLNEDDVLKKVNEIMKRNSILKQHKKITKCGRLRMVVGKRNSQTEESTGNL